MPGFLDNGAGDRAVVRKGGEGCFIGNKDPPAIQCCNPASFSYSTFLTGPLSSLNPIVLIFKVKESHNYHAACNRYILASLPFPKFSVLIISVCIWIYFSDCSLSFYGTVISVPDSKALLVLAGIDSQSLASVGVCLSFNWKTLLIMG